MLHILGLVGKGIGIALLCILILVVALLLALLFVPIRYRVAGKLVAGKADGRAKLHWLFHIVTAFAIWEGELHYGIKVFGISIYDNLRSALKIEKKQARTQEKAKKKAKKKQSKQNRQKKQTEQIEYKEQSVQPEKKVEEPRRVSKAVPKAEEQKIVSKAVPKAEEPRLVSKEVSAPEEAKTGFFKKIWEKGKAFFKMLVGLFRKLWNIPARIREKLQVLKVKITDWQETINAYRAFLEREDFKRAFALCKKQLLRAWNNIKPRKIKADIHFGFEDPSVTGQVLGYLGMAYPLLGKDIKIRPDFENAVYEGTMLIKGRITLFVLLHVLWILYFDKDIKRLIRIWKKEETIHGRK